MVDMNDRCPICDWPFAATAKDGCVPGNCCYRPRDGYDEWRRIAERRKETAIGSTAVGRSLAGQIEITVNAERQKWDGVIRGLVGYVLTAGVSNTVEWMNGLTERLNEVAEMIGDEDRFVFNVYRDMIEKVEI